MPECATILARKLSYEAIKSCVYGGTAGDYAVSGDPTHFDSLTVTSGPSQLRFTILTARSDGEKFVAQKQGFQELTTSADAASGAGLEKVKATIAGVKVLIGVVGTPQLGSVPRGEDAVFTLAEELDGVVFTGMEFLDAEGDVLLTIEGAERSAPAVAEPTTPLGREMAQQAKKIAGGLTKSGYAADFSLASLREIDRFFDEQVLNGKPRPKGLLSKDLGARVFALGAYVGEVLRRDSGGEWMGDPKDPQIELTAALRLADGTECWPTQRILKRIQAGASEGIAAWGVAYTESGGSGDDEALSTADDRDRAVGSFREWVRRWKMPLAIGVGAWLLMGFLGGWFPHLALLSLVGALLLAIALLVMSWWQILRHAWKQEPLFVLRFLNPLHFIRYGVDELPHTRRPVLMLIASCVIAVGAFAILIPVRMAGAAIARAMGMSPDVDAEAPRDPKVAARPDTRTASPNPPAGDRGTRRTSRENPASRTTGGPPKAPQTLDEALAGLTSDVASDRLKAISFINQQTPDPARTDVADVLLAELQDDLDWSYFDGLIRWGGPAHFEGMRDLSHRLETYRLDNLLTAMLAINEAETLQLCTKMFVDPDRRRTIKGLLRSLETRSEPALIPLISHGDADVRFATVELLAFCGTQAAVGPLTEQNAKEEDATVKSTLGFALREIARRTSAE